MSDGVYIILSIGCALLVFGVISLFVLALCMSAKRGDEIREDIWNDRAKEDRQRLIRETPNVFWQCIHCGHTHAWHWDDPNDAKDRGPIIMFCDSCGDETKCFSKGDGRFHHEGQPIRTRPSFPPNRIGRMTDFDERCDVRLGTARCHMKAGHSGWCMIDRFDNEPPTEKIQ